MTVRMNCANGERRFGSASMIALAAVLGCAAMPAQAQPILAVTAAQSGFFRAGSDIGTAICSDASPQFSNAAAYTGPTTCVSTIILWVTNKGNAPTVGPIVVTDALSPVMPKGSTVIATNGFCAFPGGQFGPNFVAGCSGNAGGAIAAGIWNCTVTQGNVACSTTSVLNAGLTLAPITIRFTREDYSPGSAWDHVATVSGGGSAPASVQGESVNFRQTGGEYVTIHSVPEGLPVMVDGQVVPTPHTEFWAYTSPHTIDAVYPNDGPLAGSGPWTTFLGFTTGNVSVIGFPVPDLPTTLRVMANNFTTIEGVRDGPYGEISVRYARIP